MGKLLLSYPAWTLVSLRTSIVSITYLFLKSWTDTYGQNIEIRGLKIRFQIENLSQSHCQYKMTHFETFFLIRPSFEVAVAADFY